MPFVLGMTAVYAIHKVLPELPIIVLSHPPLAAPTCNAFARAQPPFWKSR